MKTKIEEKIKKLEQEREDIIKKGIPYNDYNLEIRYRSIPEIVKELKELIKETK